MACRQSESDISRRRETTSCRINLDQNESSSDVPETLKKEILRRLGDIDWFCSPPTLAKRLLPRIAAFSGWIEEGVLIGNGSPELLQFLLLSCRAWGRGAVISEPTDTLASAIARNLGIGVHEVRMRPDFTVDIDRLVLTADRTKASLIVLCSPNNPTGTQLFPDDVRRILELTESTVLLDETYVHFARESMVPLLSRYERLVILQTFATTPGAAGLPVGYVLCWPDLLGRLEGMKPPGNVNILTLLAAEVFIDHWHIFQEKIEAAKSERARIYAELSAIPGVRPHRSEGNFILFEVLTRDAAAVHQSLINRGIRVRDVSSLPMLERALRVTIGTPEENGEFLRGLREVAR